MFEILHKPIVKWTTAGALGVSALVGTGCGTQTPSESEPKLRGTVECLVDLTKTDGQWLTETPDGVEVEEIADRLGLEPAEYRTAVGGTVFGYAETSSCDYPDSSYPSIEEVRTQKPDVGVDIEDFGPCVAYDVASDPGDDRDEGYRAPHDLKLACVVPGPYRATVSPGS